MSSDLLEYIFLCSHYSDISKMNLLFSLIFYLDSLLNHVQFIDYILSLIFTSLFPQTSGFSIVLILDGSLEHELTYKVYQEFRFVEGIWYTWKESSNPIFFRKKTCLPMFTMFCATI